MEHFTPVESAFGGVLIGLATFMVLVFQARVAGISGIMGSILTPQKGDIGWRVAFIAGMVGAGSALALLRPDLFGQSVVSRPILIAAGLLVGVGTRLANGCTSGHGVCGLSRLSRRSMAATATFMGFGALTVLVSHKLLGGA